MEAKRNFSKDGQYGNGGQMYPNVVIGEGASLEPPYIIGKPPRGKKEGELKTIIGKDAIIRPFTTIYAGNKIGDNFQTGQGVSIREDNDIGNNVHVGTNSVLEFGNKIGNNVRIHSGCFLEMVTVEDNIFVGPNIVFTDDPHPMNCPRYKECLGGAIVKELARIGANSTILPGVIIGRNSLVGAGSVVTKNVPDNSVVAGNPAKVINRVDDLVCIKGFFERPYIWEPYLEERRKFVRVYFGNETRYQLLGKERSIGIFRLSSISGGGLSLLTPKVVEEKALLKIEIKLPPEETKVFTSTQVIWSSLTQDGTFKVGAKFIEISAQEREAILQFVRNRVNAERSPLSG